ncbi:hypothetical protein [Microbacterium maritypicum]|uniref:Uncharacterized protein n=1 Tax=Microbacterium maritypicum MF109 TaxID=1333857 RepID=T5KJM2_MICMQ|nr:hypothetical protein [Microbacterium liquefaciens]EQM78215.1 hypothetical protein L687_16950 [Microbacterium maritypicum MF109]
MNENASSTDITGIAVTLGRIEEKVSHLQGMDDRLRKLEADVTEMKAQQKPKAPWWAVVGAVVGIIGGASTLIGLFVVLSSISQALANLPQP